MSAASGDAFAVEIVTEQWETALAQMQAVQELQMQCLSATLVLIGTFLAFALVYLLVRFLVDN